MIYKLLLIYFGSFLLIIFGLVGIDYYCVFMEMETALEVKALKMSSYNEYYYSYNWFTANGIFEGNLNFELDSNFNDTIIYDKINSNLKHLLELYISKTYSIIQKQRFTLSGFNKRRWDVKIDNHPFTYILTEYSDTNNTLKYFIEQLYASNDICIGLRISSTEMAWDNLRPLTCKMWALDNNKIIRNYSISQLLNKIIKAKSITELEYLL